MWHFKNHCNFDFIPLKVDKCDYCSRIETNFELRFELENHLLEVEEYRILKKTFISNENNICIEFDYYSNKSLPNLNVTGF